MHTRVLVTAGLIASLAALTASAQTSVDKSFTTVTKDCTGVKWSDSALETYPTIASACQGVEVREGKTYVKFSGEIAKNINRGEQLTIKFKDGGEVTLKPPANTALYVAGRKTPVSSLQRGDELTFYVPEDRLVARFDDDASQQVATIPLVRVVETEQVAQNLPETASQVPWLGFSGALLLVLGAGLTMRRRQQH